MFKVINNKNKISRCVFAFSVPVADRSNRILAVSTVIVFVGIMSHVIKDVELLVL
jgi:hypothetical protein